MALGAPARAEDRGDRRAIQDLLRRRAAAILDRDAEAFRATLDDPNSAFGRRQMQTFGFLAGVPLASYRLEADWSVYGDLARPRDRARYPGADEIVIPFTQERYRLEGFDRRAVFHDAYLTFVRRDGAWRIGGDDDLDDLGLFTQRSVWDFADVTTLQSDHFLAIAPACCAPDLTRLLSTAEQALDRVDRFWSVSWPKRVPLLIPGSTAELERIVQATYPVENYIAFAFWTGGGGDTAGSRVIVNPDRFAGDGSLRSFEILSHELFHIATLPSSGAFIPNWLDEGFAQLVQFGGDTGRIASFDRSVAGTGDAHIPQDYEFFVGDATTVYRNYQRSLSLAAYVTQRWGLRRLQVLYTRLGRVGTEAGVTRYHEDRAIRKTLGVSPGELRRAWASSIGVR